jgi:hypothetical protein
MATVVLDPGLLAYVQTLSKAHLIEKIELLATWSKTIATRPWVNLSLIPSGRESLENHGLIPAHEAAKQLLESSGLRNIYSPEDIIRPVYELLEKALPASYCCIREELHQDFSSIPQQPWHGGDPVVENLSEKSLLMSYVENQIHLKRKLNLFASALGVKSVQFAAQLTIVEPDALTGFESNQLPKSIQDEIRHVRSIEDICANLSPADIWAEALSATDIKLAIQLACRSKMMILGTYSGLDAVPTFLVGSEFLDSLRDWQADLRHRFAGQTLQCCVAAVLNLSTIKIKPFNKPNRTADNANPLRAHVSRAGVGIRLMMWERPGGNRTIEFANVGGKSEEQISYSHPSLAV